MSRERQQAAKTLLSLANTDSFPLNQQRSQHGAGPRRQGKSPGQPRQPGRQDAPAAQRPEIGVAELPKARDEDKNYRDGAVEKQYERWTKDLRDNAALDDPEKRSAPVKFIYSSFARRCEVLARMEKGFPPKKSKGNAKPDGTNTLRNTNSVFNTLREIEWFCQGDNCGRGFKKAVVASCRAIDLEWNATRSSLAARILSTADVHAGYGTIVDEFSKMVDAGTVGARKAARATALELCKVFADSESLIYEDYVDTTIWDTQVKYFVEPDPSESDPYQDHLKYVHGKTLAGGFYWWVILYSLCFGEPAHMLVKTGTDVNKIALKANFGTFCKTVTANLKVIYKKPNLNADAIVRRAMQYYSSALTAAQLYSLLGWAPLPKASTDDEKVATGSERIVNARLDPVRITAASALGALKGAVTTLKYYSHDYSEKLAHARKKKELTGRITTLSRIANERGKDDPGIDDLLDRGGEARVELGDMGVFTSVRDRDIDAIIDDPEYASVKYRVELARKDIWAKKGDTWENASDEAKKEYKEAMSEWKKILREHGHYDEFASGLGSKFRTFTGFIGFFGTAVVSTNMTVTKTDKDGKETTIEVKKHRADVGKANIGSIKLVLWSNAVRANFNKDGPGGKYVYPLAKELPNNRANAHERGRMLSKDEVRALSEGKRPFRTVKDAPRGKVTNIEYWPEEFDASMYKDVATETLAAYDKAVMGIGRAPGDAAAYETHGFARGFAMNKKARPLARQKAYDTVAKHYDYDNRLKHYENTAWHNETYGYLPYHTRIEGYNADGTPVYNQKYITRATPEAWEVQKAHRKTMREYPKTDRVFEDIGHLLNQDNAKGFFQKYDAMKKREDLQGAKIPLSEYRSIADNFFKKDNFTEGNLKRAIALYNSATITNKKRMGASGTLTGEITHPKWTGLVETAGTGTPKKSSAPKKKKATKGKKVAKKATSPRKRTVASKKKTPAENTVSKETAFQMFETYLKEYTTLENNGDETTMGAVAIDKLGNIANYRKDVDHTAADALEFYKGLTEAQKRGWATSRVTGEKSWKVRHWVTDLRKAVKDLEKPHNDQLKTSLGEINSYGIPTPGQRQTQVQQKARKRLREEARQATRFIIQSRDTPGQTGMQRPSQQVRQSQVQAQHTVPNISEDGNKLFNAIKDLLNAQTKQLVDGVDGMFKDDTVEQYRDVANTYFGNVANYRNDRDAPYSALREKFDNSSQQAKIDLGASFDGAGNLTKYPGWYVNLGGQLQQVNRRRAAEDRAKVADVIFATPGTRPSKSVQVQKKVQELAHTADPSDSASSGNTVPDSRDGEAKWVSIYNGVPALSSIDKDIYGLYLGLNGVGANEFFEADDRKVKKYPIGIGRLATMVNAAFGKLGNFKTTTDANKALEAYKNAAQECAKPQGTCSKFMKALGGSTSGSGKHRTVKDPDWYTDLNKALNPVRQQLTPAQ